MDGTLRVNAMSLQIAAMCRTYLWKGRLVYKTMRVYLFFTNSMCFDFIGGGNEDGTPVVEYSNCLIRLDARVGLLCSV